MTHHGEAAGRGLQRRVVQHYAVVVRSLDYATMTAVVEFKGAEGLKVRARIGTLSGSVGTLYPLYEVGDVVEAEVHGEDVREVLKDKTVRSSVRNPYLFDKSEVVIGWGLYARSGEPAGRLSGTPPGPGEFLLHHKSGARVIIESDGDIVVQPAAGKAVYLGGKTGAKDVLVDGDSNSGGPVPASQIIVKAGSP